MGESQHYNIEKSLIKFVSDFNGQTDHKNFGIVAFQFISLDKSHNGKMVWWNYLHKEKSNEYIEALNEFTGISKTGKVTNTLINWEFDKEAFWYNPLGGLWSERIVSQCKVEDFLPIISDIDKSGVEKQKADGKAKSKLLTVWKNLLKKKFDGKGSTMWVSIPHKENRIDTIYSSVFCLFNSPIPEPEQLPIARGIRNFIIDYIIDLYREPLLEEVELLSETLDLETFKPKKYNVTSEDNINFMQSLDDNFYQRKYASEFVKAKRAAKERIISTYNKSDNSFNHKNFKYPTKYPNIKTIKISNPLAFFRFIYGRFLLLSYHLVFDRSLADSYKLLTNSKKYMLCSLNLNELQKKFAIDGLRSDATDHSSERVTEIHFDTLIPNLSDQEYDLITDLCSTVYNINNDRLRFITSAKESVGS